MIITDKTMRETLPDMVLKKRIVLGLPDKKYISLMLNTFTTIRTSGTVRKNKNAAYLSLLANALRFEANVA